MERPERSHDDRAGLGPLPSSRAVVLAWAIGMAAIAAGVLTVPGPTSLDDPDLAHQQGGWTAQPATWLSGTGRPGPIPATGLPDGLVGERRFLLAFARQVPTADQLAAYRQNLRPGVPAVVVVNGPVDEVAAPPGIALVSDPDARIANGVGIHRPVDGGYPIGITIVSSEGLPAYVTLDPGWITNTFECNLVLTDVR